MTDYREIIRLHSLKFSDVAYAVHATQFQRYLSLLKHILWNGLFRKL